MQIMPSKEKYAFLLLIALLFSPIFLLADEISICTPKILDKYDTLNIMPPKTNTKLNMAIIDPVGRWFYLPLQTSINPMSTKGTFYENGTKKEGFIFTQEGTYKIILSENLETEPTNTVWFENKIDYVTPHK